MTKERTSTMNFNDFIAGWAGGISGIIVGHPGDTIKVRQQMFSTTMWVAIKKTYIHEGYTGFFKGMLFPLLTVGPATSVFFGIYGNSLQYLQYTNTVKVIIVHFALVALAAFFDLGCFGGFATVLATCPVEVVKTVLQANTEGKGNWKKPVTLIEKRMWLCMKGIYKKGGVPAFYRGFFPMLYRDVPSYGLYMLVYEVFMNNIFRQNIMHNVIRQILSGGFAGMLSWVLIIPFDVVKSRMQADDHANPTYKGMLDCFYKSYKAEGFAIFNRGFAIVCLRAFPVNAATFVGYEAILKLLGESP